MTSSGRKQNKKPKQSEDSSHLQAFDFKIEDKKKGLSDSEDEAREGASYLGHCFCFFGYISCLLINGKPMQNIYWL